jgi:hypothetical protein
VGRTEEQFSALVAEGIRYIVEDKAPWGNTVNYTEFNRWIARETGQREFDFDEGGDVCIGIVLSAINDQTRDDVGALLSALVVGKRDSDAGTGFYDYAIDRQMLDRSATGDERLNFLFAQQRAVWDKYRRPRRPRRR